MLEQVELCAEGGLVRPNLPVQVDGTVLIVGVLAEHGALGAPRRQLHAVLERRERLERRWRAERRVHVRIE